MLTFTTLLCLATPTKVQAQTIVEFSLIVPILQQMSVFVVDMGLIWPNRSAPQNTADEAALAGALKFTAKISEVVEASLAVHRDSGGRTFMNPDEIRLVRRYAVRVEAFTSGEQWEHYLQVLPNEADKAAIRTAISEIHRLSEDLEVALSGSGNGCTTTDDAGRRHEICCSDGADNDADGSTDCQDLDCADHPDCRSGQ